MSLLMKANKSQIYINLLSIVLGGLSSYFLFSSHSSISASKADTKPAAPAVVQNANDCKYKSLRETGFKFISPVLYRERECESDIHAALKATIQNFISDNTKTGRIISASVYFRDLTKGDWISVNSEQVYAPGSLAKVPMLLCYLKDAETNPAILTKKIKFDALPAEGMPHQTFNSKAIVFGHSYTVKELLEYMAAYSDNGATFLLNRDVIVNHYLKVYRDLGVDAPDMADHDYKITAKDYSRFLWVLYNGTYLSDDMSELACDILSKGDFKEGMLKELPAGLPVVHKFGQVGDLSRGEHQLHESAIIYLENKPYLLTIMTKGRNKEDLPAIISQLSALVYDHMKHA